MTKEQIDKIIADHSRWLSGDGGTEANLRGANLREADLTDGIYQLVGCGSENRCTSFDAINDRIICGCWNDKNGNHLDAFKKRIEDVYGEHGSQPNAKYYAEYMAAVKFFETVKGLGQ